MKEVRIGFHASHEQFAPSRLLRLVRQAEAAGFEAAMASDHFLPWSGRQGQSGFVWSWLGAALEATAFDFGTVNAPVQRYHPAVVAQAAATLAEMYPGRFWIAAGSGENLNEHITGERWPAKEERNRRLLEAVEVMRRLWRGETVTHAGLVRVQQARLYTRPTSPPLLLGAALTPETARWQAGWADGLLTLSQPAEKMERLLAAWREGGGAGKPAWLQVKLSWAGTEEAARREAWDQWRTNCLEGGVAEELRLPEHFDAVAQTMRPEAIDPHLVIGADPALHRRALERYAELGFERLYLHNVARDQEAFIETFGREVLPHFR